MGTPDKLNPAAAKDFVHVRVNTSGSPLEFPGALTHATVLFVEMLARLSGRLIFYWLFRAFLIWLLWYCFCRIIAKHWKGKGEA
jgi:hypothetical protein